MYFKDFIDGLRRRWYVALIGLVVTAGLCVGIVSLVPVTYTSTTSLLMLPPRSSVTSKGNIYLNLNGLGQALEVMSTKINASDQTRQITDAHPDASIDVGPDATTTGPILLISSTANSPQESLEVRDQLAGLAPQVLVSMQDELGIQPNSRISLSVLAQDPKPERSVKGQLRAVIAVAAVGGAGTILGTGYLDYFLALRSGGVARRRRRRPQPAQTPGSDTWWDAADSTTPEARATVSATAANGSTHPTAANGSTPTAATNGNAPAAVRPGGTDER